ncbi:MAG: hypothetical protein ACM3O7_06460 [Acidobacteriota bacterium]
MRPAVALMLLAAAPALAQKPWELRVDLPIAVPIELPAVPATNPFAAPLSSPPTYAATPLREKFNARVEVQGAAYIDAAGACRRVVFTRLPLPGMSAELQQTVMETDFTPARQVGQSTPTWVTFSTELAGRIKEGRVARLLAVPPTPVDPPVADESSPPAPDVRDLALPATPVEQVDQAPAPKRFRARLDSRTWLQKVRILVEVSPQGRCTRVVFLSCPDGLRPWLLASLGEWTFQPGRRGSAPVAAWTTLDGEVEVSINGFDSDALRIIPRSSYPRGSAAPDAARPPSE